MLRNSDIATSQSRSAKLSQVDVDDHMAAGLLSFGELLGTRVRKVRRWPYRKLMVCTGYPATLAMAKTVAESKPPLSRTTADCKLVIGFEIALILVRCKAAEKWKQPSC